MTLSRLISDPWRRDERASWSSLTRTGQHWNTFIHGDWRVERQGKEDRITSLTGFPPRNHQFYIFFKSIYLFKRMQDIQQPCQTKIIFWLDVKETFFLKGLPISLSILNLIPVHFSEFGHPRSFSASDLKNTTEQKRCEDLQLRIYSRNQWRQPGEYEFTKGEASRTSWVPETGFF